MNSEAHVAGGEADLVPVATLVVWMLCGMVGGVGLLMPYPRPHPPAASSAPVQAQMMHVELTPSPAPPEISPEAVAAPVPDSPSPPPPIAAMASLPPLMAVTELNPTVSFPLPVKEPVRQAQAQAPAATMTAASTQSSPAAPDKPQNLTFGQGEGRQPAPEYPREAVMARQQGVVGIRFTVGEDGRVQTVQVVAPSPFPLLNQSAARTVRETWRFIAGSPRSYEVLIQFQLKDRG